MNSSPQPDLKNAIDQLWLRFLPTILERVRTMEAAAAACAEQKLTHEQQEAAYAAAHKLAGTLGTFNLDRGTVLAREAELLFTLAARPSENLTARLSSLTSELRALIENRPAS